MGPGVCALDEPSWAGSIVEIPNTGTLVIRGWAFGEPGQPVPDEIFCELFSERTVTTERVEANRMIREDVAIHFGDSDLAASGFAAQIALGGFRMGRYSVHLVQRGVSGMYRLENLLQFSVLSETYEMSARAGLARKFLKGKGIEIGALQRKLTLPPDCSVRYVDRMGLSDLQQHYPELNGIPLQAPDVVDDGEQLTRFADGSLDFVVANHFLEHCENPIRTLANFLRVLHPHGILYMAVPDKRTTFDQMRPLTQWQVLKHAYQAGARSDRVDLYSEWSRFIMQCAGDQVERMVADLLTRAYSIHFNVWDLGALLEFILRCKSEIGLPFEPASIVCCENETIVILERL